MSSSTLVVRYGTSGTSGTAGTSGISGTSGTAGTSGLQGTSGTSGTSPASQISGTGTSGQVSYFTGAQTIASSSQFLWNGTNGAVVGGDISGFTVTARTGTSGTAGYTYLNKVWANNESKLVTNTVGTSVVGQGVNNPTGTSSSYLNIPYVAGDTTPSAFSIEAWVYITAVPSSATANVCNLISRRQGTGGNNYWYGLGLTQAMVPYFQILDNTTTLKSVSYTPGSLSLNVWYHIVGTWDGTTMNIYVNGVKSTSFTTWSGTLFNGTGNGNWYALRNDTNNTYYIPGIIDEIRSYNSRALSASEVSQSYNMGNGTYTPIGSGCTGQWHLDGDVVDATSTHSLGSISGSDTFVSGKVASPSTIGDMVVIDAKDAASPSVQGELQFGSSNSDTFLVGTNVNIGSLNSLSSAVDINKYNMSLLDFFDQSGNLVLGAGYAPTYSTSPAVMFGIYYNAVATGGSGSNLISYKTYADILMVGQSGNPTGEVTVLGNTWIGRAAGSANTTGTRMIGIGPGALQSATTGSDCVAIGYTALAGASTRQTRCIAIGTSALQNLTDVNAWDVIGIGFQSLYASTNGNNVVALGNLAGTQLSYAGYTVIIGQEAAGATGAQSLGYSVAIGFQAGYHNYGSTNSVLVGYQAGLSYTTTTDNVAIGYQAGYYSNSSNNVLLGTRAGYRTTSGGQNVAIGYYSLGGNTAGSTTTAGNVAIGYYAMKNIANSSLGRNTAVGWSSLTALTSDDANTAVGYASGRQVIGGGGYNVIMGVYAGDSVTTGGSNVAIGANSLYGNGAGALTGSNNTVLGVNAAFKATGAAACNTVVGMSAGHEFTTATGGVFLGYYAGYYETSSNSFYLNNVNQTNTAGDKAYSLLYGTFSGTGGSLTGQQLTINGKLNTTDSTTTAAGLNVPPGMAPNSPTDGDVWTTTSGIYVRINGVTVGPLIDASAGAGSTLYLYNNYV